MARTVQGTVLLLSLGLAAAAAQERPNFTGEWVMDMTRSESAAQGPDVSPRRPVRMDITHTPTALTVKTATDERSESQTYSFDANQDRSRAVGTDGSANRKGEQALARWQGEKLITETVYLVNGMAATKTETRHLSADGKEMIVETQLQIHHGYQSSGRGPEGSYTAVKDVYTRTNP